MYCVLCVVEGSDGVQIRAFDGNCTAFLRDAESSQLKSWMNGIGLEQVSISHKFSTFGNTGAANDTVASGA